MNRKQVNALLKKLGKPVVYRRWKKGTNPELPYLVFYFSTNHTKYADNSNYQDHPIWHVEVWSEAKEDALEEELEGIFKDAGLTYQKHEAYLEDQDLFQVFYIIQTI